MRPRSILAYYWMVPMRDRGTVYYQQASLNVWRVWADDGGDTGQTIDIAYVTEAGLYHWIDDHVASWLLARGATSIAWQ
jgi:hypothetical protein